MHFPLDRRTLLKGGTATALSAMLPSMAGAQSATAWPTKPVTLLVPGSPGGTADPPTRAHAAALTKSTGQPVIVDFRAGGGGVPGTVQALRGPVDGSVLFQGNTATHAINFSLHKNLPYGVDDFVPLCDFLYITNAVVVNSASPIRSFAQLLDEMKKKNGRMTYGSGGVGQTSHLAAEVLALKANGKLTHVPYRGGAPSVVALLANEVDFMIQNLSLVLPHLQSGQMRALAVTSHDRFGKLPAVPTIGELGFPDLNMNAWLGYFVPAKTPRSLIATLSETLRSTAREPAIVERMLEMGLTPGRLTQEQFAEFLASERRNWGEVIRLNNILPA